MDRNREETVFHYARLTQDFENSEVEGPEVFHFVALEGDDDWVEVQLERPVNADLEPAIRETVKGHFEPKYSEKRDCWFEPMRITRRWLRLQGADFVEIGQ